MPSEPFETDGCLRIARGAFTFELLHSLVAHPVDELN